LKNVVRFSLSVSEAALKKRFRACSWVHVMLLAILVILPSSGTVEAQYRRESNFDSAWFAVGLGGGTAGISASMSLGARFGGLAFSAVGMISNRVRRVDIGGFIGEREIGDISLQVGWADTDPDVHVSATMGPALVLGTSRRSDQSSDDISTFTRFRPTPGLALSLRAVVPTSENFGLGIRGFADLNLQRPWAGIEIGFYFGDFR